jgi:hypothetical protein
MLAKFGKRPVSDIIRALLEFDAEGLGISAVSSLVQFLPTGEDLAAIAKYLNPPPSRSKAPASSSSSGDAPVEPPPPRKLGKVEEYLLAMSKVPKAEQRLNALSSYLSLQDSLAGIQNSAEAILRAVTEVRGSARLKYLFNTILEVGNLLASKSKKVPVIAGFKLSALSKLGNVKSNSGDTILQYIVSRIYEQLPEAIDLSGDMPSINEARLVVFSRLQADLHKMESGIETMVSLQQEAGVDVSATNPEANNEVAMHSLQRLLEESVKAQVRAKTKLDEALADFKELIEYFGEEKDSLPETLFALVQGFVKSVETCANVASAKAKKLARVDLFKRL